MFDLAKEVREKYENKLKKLDELKQNIIIEKKKLLES